MTGAVTSETEICNLALTSIGASMISSLDEGTKAADLCTLHYPRCRRALLRAHPWNFAIARVTLALSSTTPNHEFGYQHALPADCLKVIRTGWEADGTIGPAIYGFPGFTAMPGTGCPIASRAAICSPTRMWRGSSTCAT